jgi:hypothetical protein
VNSTRRVRTGGYTGLAELLIDGEPRTSVEVELVGYREETTTATFGGGTEAAGGELEEWEGRVVGNLGGGLTEFDMVMAGAFTLRTPGGRTGDVIFQDARQFTGSGSPPFDM